VIDEVARRATTASPYWAEIVRDDLVDVPVYGPLCGERFALGMEQIHEGYLVHHRMSRAFAPRDAEQRILLGDHLYALGLADICRAGELHAVAALAELIARVSDLRARGLDDDPALWRATAEALT
jgi:hypothetical protein